MGQFSSTETFIVIMHMTEHQMKLVQHGCFPEGWRFIWAPRSSSVGSALDFADTLLPFGASAGFNVTKSVSCWCCICCAVTRWRRGAIVAQHASCCFSWHPRRSCWYVSRHLIPNIRDRLGCRATARLHLRSCELVLFVAELGHKLSKRRATLRVAVPAPGHDAVEVWRPPVALRHAAYKMTGT